MSVIRAFIAINFSPEIYRNLDRTFNGLKTRLQSAAIRWTPTNNIHLTIKFLGDVSIASQEMLTKALQAAVSKHMPFEICVEELGVFPSIRRPRVIWVGVKAPPELHSLQQGVETEMARLGYASDDRPFSPHLTLGRVARSANSSDIQRISAGLSNYQVGSLGACRVQYVHLYRSDLHPGGSVYTRLFTASLASGDR